jgi:hypothetical protein
MKDYVKEQVHRYFGNDLPKLTLLGITKYAVYTYVSRVYEDRSKESAMNGSLQSTRLDPAQIEFVWSVLDRLPLARTLEAD